MPEESAPAGVSWLGVGGSSAQLGGRVSQIGRHGGRNAYKVLAAMACTWPSGPMTGA